MRAHLRAAEVRRAVAGDLRRVFDDAGLRQAAVARAAHISPATISRLLRGEREASLETLARIAVAVGGELSVRIVPGAGLAIHDRIQARMVDAFVRALHGRWTPFLEVPVRTPARGAIDLVLADTIDGGLVATEFHSELRRAEEAIRWSNEKAAALVGTDLYRMAAAARADRGRPAPSISRLLVLRSTPSTRAVVGELPALFAAAYPIPSGAAVAALRRGDPWPGPALAWMRVHGSEAHVLGGAPRRIGVSGRSRAPGPPAGPAAADHAAPPARSG